MAEGDEGLGAAAVESVVRRLWASHGLPPSSGTLGRGSGAALRQLLGTYTPGDAPALVAHRAVAADVDARAAALSGGRAIATLRREARAAEAPDPVIPPLLDALAIWAGGSGGRPYDAEDRRAGVQKVASRLARLGVLVARDGPVRLCPSCAAPRSPERTIYHEELGDTFLVRFPLEAEGDAPAVDALAWVDAPWRLLGTTALLVSPDLPYATVEYRRGDVVARLLTLRSSLGRLRSWLSGVELTVVDEKPGRHYAGRRYVYPLRHEFPDGAALPAPSGTVQAIAEVGDSGTGIVPLVPGHGGSDAQIAERLGIQGWPLLTVHGMLDLTLMHKYSGLDLETASEFVARDLTEGGSVLARLRVLRGVPYCGVCGRPVVWFPGRCWCLEPGRLPAEQVARYGQLLPHERPIGEIEVTAWPVSETHPSDAPEAVSLLECERCSRLEAPDGPLVCPCGGNRRVVARRLTPSVAGAFAQWSRNDPVPPGDPVRIYVGERRRAPAVVHHLAAMAGIDASGAEVQATILPTVSDVDLVGLVQEHGADAVRAAFVRTGLSDGPGGSFAERCRQERRRLGHLVELANATALAVDRAGGGTVSASPTDRDLEPEDRALLARWAATELRALASYEELRPADAHRRISRFLEVDLAHYQQLVRARDGSGASATSRRAAARTLATTLASVATALAPIAPFTAEAVVRTLRPEPRSLFETEPFDVDRPPADESLAQAWDRWLAVVRAVDRFRADHHLSPGAVVPSVALVVPDDELGDKLRGDRSLLERLARVGRLEVGSPRSPWEGRRRQLVPVDGEIQRVYPAIASQISHLLRRMPPRKPGDLEGGRGFSVFVQGQPHQITPEMLTVVESLPERVVPAPFGLGEMYAEVPAGPAPAAEGPLALSSDASWLVRRVARRLKDVGPEAAQGLTVRVLAIDPLARELRERWAAIAATLGVTTLTIDAPPPVPERRPSLSGRTHLGARWAVEIPGLERRPVPRARPSSWPAPSSTRRMPLRRLPTAAAPEVDFTDQGVIHHEDEVRALGEQLDQLLDAPLLGPAKVTLAWEAGYTTVGELTSASFEELSTLPGFGRPVAARLFSKLGRNVPPPPPRVRRAPPPPPPEPAEEAWSQTSEPVAVVAQAPRVVPRASVAARVAAEPVPSSGADAQLEDEVPPVEDDAREAEPLEAVSPPGAAEPELLPPEEPPAPGASIPFAPIPGSGELAKGRRGFRPAPAPTPLSPEFVGEASRRAAVSAAPAAPAVEPPPVGLEVNLTDTLLPALQPFLDATAAGHRGLALVRELPERIRTLVGPRPVAVYWLTNLVRDRTVRPGDLQGISTLIRQGLEANGISAVFLEGVEYLTRIHGTAAVSSFLRELDRLAREHDARAWLHLTPGLLGGPDLDRMLTELGLKPASPEPAEAQPPEPVVPIEPPRPEIVATPEPEPAAPAVVEPQALSAPDPAEPPLAPIAPESATAEPSPPPSVPEEAVPSAEASPPETPGTEAATASGEPVPASTPEVTPGEVDAVSVDPSTSPPETVTLDPAPPVELAPQPTTTEPAPPSAEVVVPAPPEPDASDGWGASPTDAPAPAEGPQETPEPAQEATSPATDRADPAPAGAAPSAETASPAPASPAVEAPVEETAEAAEAPASSEPVPPRERPAPVTDETGSAEPTSADGDGSGSSDSTGDPPSSG